jgi:hypothetical protein
MEFVVRETQYEAIERFATVFDGLAHAYDARTTLQ